MKKMFGISDDIFLYKKMGLDFNCLEFEAIKNKAGDNGFVMTPKRWIEATGAKGIVSKQGRYVKCRFIWNHSQTMAHC